MARLKQSFHNATDRSQIINLEPSAARFRLNPGETLALHYDSDEVQDQSAGAALRIDIVDAAGTPELSVWTFEDEMFFPDGRSAPRDYNPD